MITFKQFIEASHSKNKLSPDEKAFADALALGPVTPDGMQDKISSRDTTKLMDKLKSWSKFNDLEKETQDEIIDKIIKQPDVTSYKQIFNMIYD